MNRLQENLSSSPVVLDLCIKKRPPTPPLEEQAKKQKHYDSILLSSCQYSPVSNNSNSDFEGEPAISPIPPSLYPTTLKQTRPFKAYTKSLDSLKISSDVPFTQNSAVAFELFKEKVMSQVAPQNCGTNKNMRRVPQNPKCDDPDYLEKRRKNNEAAKRSRDARRKKEDEIAIRCAFLEQENMQLRYRLAAVENELQSLQKLMFRQK